jgi:hypothetical protein
MQYPKPVMRISDLKKMGFTEQWLLMVYNTTKGIAWKTGTAPNCPILFDVEALERYRVRSCVRS